MRLRIGLLMLAMAAGIGFLALQTFGGSAMVAEKTDPAVAQATWNQLIHETTQAKQSKETSVALPTIASGRVLWTHASRQ